MLKSMASLVALAIAAYGVFFVDLGGKPFAEHLREVWTSPTVQSKVALVRDGVRNELEDRLAEAADRTTRKALRDPLGAGEDLDPADTEALEKVIAQ